MLADSVIWCTEHGAYHKARGMPRFLLRLPKSQTRQLHFAANVSSHVCMSGTEVSAQEFLQMSESYQWPKASCSKNDASKLVKMRSNL